MKTIYLTDLELVSFKTTKQLSTDKVFVVEGQYEYGAQLVA